MSLRRDAHEGTCQRCKVGPAELVCFTTGTTGVESKMPREMLRFTKETAACGHESRIFLPNAFCRDQLTPPPKRFLKCLPH